MSIRTDKSNTKSVFYKLLQIVHTPKSTSSLKFVEVLLSRHFLISFIIIVGCVSTHAIQYNPKFEVLCQIIAYLHIPADQIFHPDAATDGLKKQKLLLMLQECDEQEAAEILPAIEYLKSISFF